MKKLSLEKMETIEGGDVYDTINGIACGISLAWPLGTLIAGPTCLGLSIGQLVR